MPRRCVDNYADAGLTRKRVKVEDSASVDLSFCDDEVLTPGIIFTDVLQKQWRIGKPIGRGSFGRIYLASNEVDKEVTKQSARYVVKIEPHSNGPLFVEIHCLIRSAQAAKVREWRMQHDQKRLGMPLYIASGSFTDTNTNSKYRFLVLPRYDVDLQKIISRCRTLDLKNTLVLAIQILDVLEYLHSQGYTHSDIKSSNLMLGFDSNPFLEQPIRYQKVDKQVKSKKSGSSYYRDEDFVLKNGEDLVKGSRPRKVYHKRQKFNLRQVNNVNYEDLNSSICSDDAYQILLDGLNTNYSSDEGFHSDHSKREKKSNAAPNVDINKEAIYSQSKGQIYLLDYGLASKFLDNEGNHKEFDMDARKAHDGTLEYSSRDSHVGAHSRRSDLETLGYNIIDWLTGRLPWKTVEMLQEPDLVHALKKKYMDNVKTMLKTCFKNDYPEFIESYLVYVRDLDFKEQPDYEYCRSLFRNAINNLNGTKDLTLDFEQANINKKLHNKIWNLKTFERENMTTLENSLKLEIMKQTLNCSSDGERKPCSVRNFFVSDAELVANLKKNLLPQVLYGKKLSPKNLRSHKRNTKKRKGKKSNRSSIGKFGNFMGSARQFTWAEILAGNPEDLLRKDRTVTSYSEDEDDYKYSIKNLPEQNDETALLNKDYPNPTYAMKEVIAKFKNKTVKKEDDLTDRIEGYTPAMMSVARLIEARKAKDIKPEVRKPESSSRATRSRNKAPFLRKDLLQLEPTVCISPLTLDKWPRKSRPRAIKKMVEFKDEAIPDIKDKTLKTRSSRAVNKVVKKERCSVPSTNIRTRSTSRRRLCRINKN